MEKYYRGLLQVTLTVAGSLLLAGCMKDDCKHTFKIYSPVYKTLSQLRLEVGSQAARPFKDPGKLYIIGDKVYVNEKNKGIHVIDNSNPRLPRNTAFINIPGNIDIAMKDNILYADMHCDLAAIDVSRPEAVTVKKYLTKAFPSQVDFYSTTTNPDSIKVVIDWIGRDTVMDCDSYNRIYACMNCALSIATGPSAYAMQSSAPSGTAGSMARFAAVDNYLYTLDNNVLNTVAIADAANPQLLKRQLLRQAAETIYPFNKNLFIGTPTGLVAYSIQDPASPLYLSAVSHWRNCDPVIADDTYAYVTIYDGAACGGGAVNELEIYDIKNLLQPARVKSYSLTNPKGLSKDGNLLFICDGRAGLKIFDASDVLNLKMLRTISGPDTYDVITRNGIAYVVAKDGLYQYDYSNIRDIHLLSRLQWALPSKK